MLLVQGPLSEGIHYRLHSGDTLLLETQVCLSPWEPCRVSCTFEASDQGSRTHAFIQTLTERGFP